jgi:hypothetical protein
MAYVEQGSQSKRAPPIAAAAVRSQAPRSSYYFGPPSADSAFGSPPVGVIGRDKPREVIR